MQSSEEKLPPLREDLELIPGGVNDAGDETFVVRDVRANQYVKIGADIFKILANWQTGVPLDEFIQILRENNIDISSNELKDCLGKLSKAQLIDTDPQLITKSIIEKEEKYFKNIFDSFIHNYLFFKIPIFYPDKFVKSALKYSDIFFSKSFIIFSLSLAVVCIFFLIPQVDRLKSAFLISGNFEMTIKFGIALIISKSIHELSHAFAAARKGCHVGSIGIGFIVGAPVFYADVTDTWRLKDKNDRMIVASAGVISELLLAIYATMFWLLNISAFTNDITLYLASVTWITTVLFNANPLMRFDGYYLLSDFLNIKNLQQKSFSIVGQKFREIVFGFHFQKQEGQRALILYGVGAVLYRILVITGVALVLYNFVFRLLGFFLFGVEIWIFLLKPLVGQFNLAWKNKNQVASGRAEIGGFLLLAVIASIIFLPFDLTLTVPGIGTREQVIGLFERYDAEVHNNIIDRPVNVKPGMILGPMNSAFMSVDLSSSDAEVNMLRRRYERISVAPLEREFLFSLGAELEKSKVKRSQLIDQKSKINIISPIEGYFLPRGEFHQGQILGARTFIGTVISGGNRAIAFVPEKYFYRINKGMSALFYNSFDMKGIKGRVVEIEKSSVEKLRFPQMASVYGGPLKAHGTIQNGLYSDEAIYRVIIQLEESELFTTLQMGSVAISVNKTSLAESFINLAGRTFWREAHLD